MASNLPSKYDIECQICESKQNITDIQTPRFRHLITKVETITDSQVEHRNWLRFVCLLCTAKLDHLWKFQNLCKNAYRKFLETLVDTDPSFEIIEKCENDIEFSSYSEPLDMEEEEEKKHFPAQETVILWEGGPTEDPPLPVDSEFHPIKLPLLKEEKMKICDEEEKNLPNNSLPGIDAFKTEVAPVEISLKRSDSPNRVEDFCANTGMKKISLNAPGKENFKKPGGKTKPIESEPVKCSTCNKEFKQRQTLRTHMKEVHQKILNFVCDICGKGFTRKEPYRNHLEIHSEKRSQFSCAICGKIFTQKRNLLRHIIGIHIDRSKRQIAKSFCRHCKSRFNTREEYLEHVRKTHLFARIGTSKLERQKLKSRKSCSSCAKVFKTSQALEAHERIHSGEKPFACKICSKRFRKDHHLKIHMNVHTRVKKDLKDQICKYCCITFTNKTDYYRHLKTHPRLDAVKKKIQCQYCRKEFTNNQQRQNHEMIHTGEKPFKCEICSKEFRQGQHLRTHMNIHTGEKKYPCDFCDKVFTLAGNMRVHRRIHTGEKPYECSHCSERFPEQKMWKKHSAKCSEES